MTTRRALLGAASFVAVLPILIPGAITLAQAAGPAASNLPVYTVTPSNPWPLPTLGAHPRLYLTPARLARFRANWNNPPANMLAIKNVYNALSPLTNDAAHILANLFRYLATGDLTALQNAYNNAITGTAGSNVCLYTPLAPFVFDWGYADLTPAQKTALISLIDSQNTKYYNAAPNGPLAGAGADQGYGAFTHGMLAIQGEAGATDRSVALRNMLQNVCAWIDETMADGHWVGYPSDGTYFTMWLWAYHIAGGIENLITSRFAFAKNRAKLVNYRCTAAGGDYIAAPSDQKGIGSPSPTNALPKQDGTTSDKRSELACQWAMYAEIQGDGLAQRLANQISTVTTTNKWGSGFYSDTAYPVWLALAFYNPAIPETSLSSLPISQIFPKPGQVAFRSGWSNPATSVRGWLCSPMFMNLCHDTHYAGCLEVWRGDDMLICNEYTYAGQPCAWQTGYQTAKEVGSYSMCKSTLLFSPKGSSTPDRSGAQTHIMKPESPAAFPVGTLLGGTSCNFLAGTVGNFVYNGAAPGATTQATATYTDSYYPNTTVTNVQRIVAYVNGADEAHGTFFVQDNFTLVPGAVDRIRALWGCRQKPVGMTGETVVAGTSAAGILTYANQPVKIQWRNSQATIQMVSPAHVTLRLVGGGHGINGAPAGPGYESYFDGFNNDFNTNGQSGRTPDVERRINGVWRLECETTPAAAKGQMLFAITVGDIGSTAPTYTKAQVLGIMAVKGTVIVVPE